jgi:hypothetical protein
MNNSTRHTRINSLLSNINNFKFALAVGHGQHEPSLPPVLVPKNTYVIFTSKPGYLGDSADVANEKFKSIFQNTNKVRKLLLGTLSPEEKPTLLTNKHWDWKKHIYPPESVIANHSLEFYDSPQPGNTENLARSRIIYDSLAGLWKIGTPGRQFHGTKQNLQTILNTARSQTSGKLIVFISGCRGDPAISRQSMNQAMTFTPNMFRRYFQVPQNYNIPLTNYIRSVQALENHSRRYMTLKRKAPDNQTTTKIPKINNLSSEVRNAALLWEKYKNDFINLNDPTAVLRASFLVSYVLFKIEFKGLPYSAYMEYSSTSNVERNLENIRTIAEGPNAHIKPGLNYKGAWAQTEPFFTNKSKGFASMMLWKKSHRQALVKNGLYVKIDSQEYKNAENDMVNEIQRISSNRNLTTALNRNYRNAFKYTYYGSESKFINSFFFHCMTMLGWWGFYGFRYSQTQRKWVGTEHPGSCNVAGLINMYLFKKIGKLDDLVYIAHGSTSVSRASAINSMTAQRAEGGDDVQFCHHGWQVAGEKPLGMAGAATSNMYNYRMRWRQRTLYSHSDAFDVLTLAPIFRCIQRLKRQKRESQVKVVKEFLHLLNTRIKDFLNNHLLSNLPRGSNNITGEMNRTSVVPKRSTAMRQTAARQAAAIQTAVRQTAARQVATPMNVNAQNYRRGLNLSLNIKNNFSKYRNMINNIAARNLTTQQARTKYPNFFRNISNENSSIMVNGMKRLNVNNIQAKVGKNMNTNTPSGKIASRINTLIRRSSQR